MYQNITNEDPLKTPMRVYPAVHYTMGGLWVDYELMTSVQGLYALGEANFSDSGANRLGPSALMQGLADGYFIAPYTIGDYLARNAEALKGRPDAGHAEFKRTEAEVSERINKLAAAKGQRTPNEIHREVGRLMWDKCGMARNASGLSDLLKKLPDYRKAFWQ